MTFRFDKYEGLGNDFVVVDSDSLPSAAFVQRVCDRHFGVGADGVLVVSRPRAAEARARMTVINADGSRPEMCGNGLRCVGLHLARQDDVRTAEYRVETDAGVLTCAVERDGPVAQAVVGIGKAESLGELSVPHGGTTLRFHRVSVGNPHAITVLDAQLPVDVIDRISSALSAQVAGGTNVEFVVPSGDGWNLVVWERGVGRTLACGTGACATVAALAVLGRAPYDRPVRVRLPGGDLEVTVSRLGLSVLLRGPSRHVFAGSLSEEAP